MPNERCTLTKEAISELWDELAATNTLSVTMQHIDALCSQATLAIELEKLLTAASHALRSYQYGNSSPYLAADVADKIDAALQKG